LSKKLQKNFGESYSTIFFKFDPNFKNIAENLFPNFVRNFLDKNSHFVPGRNLKAILPSLKIKWGVRGGGGEGREGRTLPFLHFPTRISWAILMMQRFFPSQNGINRIENFKSKVQNKKYEQVSLPFVFMNVYKTNFYPSIFENLHLFKSLHIKLFIF
jgi:hypothetical protein